MESANTQRPGPDFVALGLGGTAAISFGRWGFAGAGKIVHMNQRFMADPGCCTR